MQAFFQSIFNDIKSKLCQRRKSTPTINKFAVMQRTNMMVRKPSRGLHVSWSNDGENQIQQMKDNKQEEQKSQEVVDVEKSEQQFQQQQKSIQQQSYPAINQMNEPKKKVKQSTYTVKVLPQLDQKNSQAPTDTSQLIMSQLRLSSLESQLQSVLQQISFLQLQNTQRKKQFWKSVYTNYSNQRLDNELSNFIDQEQQHRDDVLDDMTLMKMYQVDIEDVRDLKYSFQLKNYPEISLECYSDIRRLWAMGKKNQNFIIKQMKLKILEKLIARSFRTLSFGAWLNDQIINAYLEMIDNKAAETGNKYRVLNSFFAQTTFSKSSEMICRALKRRNIEPSSQIIIAINNGTHWFFARIQNSKVIVYDSIPKDPCYYQSSESTGEIFNNIMNFAKWYYGKEHQIYVDQGYPRQKNSVDCGMFLLCGIKDIVRDEKSWTFEQEDINFKRVLVAKELIDEQITGFEN